MANQEQKEYVPKSSVKEVTFQNGNVILKGSAKADELIEFIKARTNAKGYFNWGISRRKEPGKHGETHTWWHDNWQPDPNRQQSQPGPRPPLNLAQKVQWPDDPKPAQDDQPPF